MWKLNKSLILKKKAFRSHFPTDATRNCSTFVFFQGLEGLAPHPCLKIFPNESDDLRERSGKNWTFQLMKVWLLLNIYYTVISHYILFPWLVLKKLNFQQLLNERKESIRWTLNIRLNVDFLINPLFGYPYCIKFTFDKNYRYNASSIGLISDWIKVSCSQADF